MKKLIRLLFMSLIVIVAASCSHGAKAIDKAYEQACEGQSSEKVAMTLCNGDIQCATLTSDEAAKLGAVLGYVTFTGLYTADFQAQVDMYEFGKLMKDYKQLELRQDGTDKQLIEKYTQQIFATQPNLPEEK
ncbi:MAG: hypothetical protein J1D77_05070 [Muribaculaceae bacterium]|nr:hypothetical protein [Muribaculaceae bacterium]